MGSSSFQRQIFVSDSSVKYGWDPAFIKLKLHEKYQDSFDPTKLDEYDNYLAELKSRTVETLPSLDRPRVTIVGLQYIMTTNGLVVIQERLGGVVLRAVLCILFSGKRIKSAVNAGRTFPLRSAEY